jgi:ABC-type multidrug transport system ATPase subunit
VLGHDVVDDYRMARRMLGVVPQELVFDPFFTVRETLRLQSGYFGLTRNDDWIDEIMANLDLTNKADSNMRQLSGGMKRRVLVAQALVHRPPVIVLDEPTAGVDVELRQTLWKFISRLNREGHTIILTTHYLEEAEALCDRIAMLKFGEVVALDRTSNLLTQFAGLQLVLTLSRGTLPPALEALRTPSNPGARASPAPVRIRSRGADSGCAAGSRLRNRRHGNQQGRPRGRVRPDHAPRRPDAGRPAQYRDGGCGMKNRLKSTLPTSSAWSRWPWVA